VDRVEELRTVYQLELEREIAARREHELTVERELREQIERRERADVAGVRAELQSLRDTLKHLLGGDVLVERVALRAESTRLRPLTDHTRTFTDHRGRTPAADVTVPRSLTVAGSADTVSRPATQAYPVAEPAYPVAEPAHPVAGPARPVAEPARPAEEDTGFMERSWRPAVIRTPSWEAATDSTEAPTVRRDWRRSAEPDPPAPATRQAPAHGGPAGRASEPGWESPIWNSLMASKRTPPTEPGSNGNGSQPGSAQPGSAAVSPVQGQSPGAHRGGRSVSDLLAAYGKDPAPRPRRRRQDG